MSQYQRHLYSNRLRRCPKRVAALTRQILVIKGTTSRELFATERAQIGELEAQKNRIMDRHAELSKSL